MRTNVTIPKKAFFATAIAMTSILSVIAVAEVVLRAVDFEYALYPTKVQVGWPDPKTLTELYEADRDLLWVPKWYGDRLAEWQDKRPSIVFMGCSCTELGKYDDLLESRIETHYPGNQLSYMNVGVSSWTSYQGLQQLKRDVAPLAPRVVTIFYGWNDHWDSFGIEDKEIGAFNLQHSSQMLKQYERWRVLQLIGKAYFNFKTSDEPEQMPKRVSLADYRSNLQSIVRTAKEKDIIPVLMTAPTSHERGREPKALTLRWLKDLSELVPLHEEYVQVVRDVAAEEDAHLVDLNALFRALPPKDLARSFHLDGIHLKTAGDNYIAKFIFEYFEENDLMQYMIDKSEEVPSVGTHTGS